MSWQLNRIFHQQQNKIKIRSHEHWQNNNLISSFSFFFFFSFATNNEFIRKYKRIGMTNDERRNDNEGVKYIIRGNEKVGFKDERDENLDRLKFFFSSTFNVTKSDNFKSFFLLFSLSSFFSRFSVSYHILSPFIHS